MASKTATSSANRAKSGSANRGAAGSGARSSKSASAKSGRPARPPAPKSPARKPARKPAPHPSPVATAGAAVGRGARAGWLMLAKGAGTTARSVGRARELEPGHRRDGIALALRAGAQVADLEFIQFHPTMLYTAGARGRRTLISEAVRGEGGRLVDVDGRSVTAGVHPMGDLAPRDVVADAATTPARSST